MSHYSITRAQLMLALALLVFNFIGCSSASKYDLETAEGLYQSGLELEKDERYEEAVTRFLEVKNKHPYSRFATEAELRVADVHFKREAFIEAQAAYQSFKDLHPKFPRIDYVTFQLGMSYFNQLPETIDRDISLTTNAIVFFEEVINSYPKSKFVREAKKRKQEAIKMEAEKEYYIGDFYFKREMYDSALARFETLLIRYPKSVRQTKALYGAAFSAYKLGEQEKEKKYLSELVTDYPDSEEAHLARRKIRK